MFYNSPEPALVVITSALRACMRRQFHATAKICRHSLISFLNRSRKHISNKEHNIISTYYLDIDGQ